MAPYAWVRYRPNELGDAGLDERIEGVAAYRVLNDNTVVLHNAEGDRIGVLHPDRWDAVVIYDDDKEDADAD